MGSTVIKSAHSDMDFNLGLVTVGKVTPYASFFLIC